MTDRAGQILSLKPRLVIAAGDAARWSIARRIQEKLIDCLDVSALLGMPACLVYECTLVVAAPHPSLGFEELKPVFQRRYDLLALILNHDLSSFSGSEIVFKRPEGPRSHSRPSQQPNSSSSSNRLFDGAKKKPAGNPTTPPSNYRRKSMRVIQKDSSGTKTEKWTLDKHPEPQKSESPKTPSSSRDKASEPKRSASKTPSKKKEILDLDVDSWSLMRYIGPVADRKGKKFLVRRHGNSPLLHDPKTKEYIGTASPHLLELIDGSSSVSETDDECDDESETSDEDSTESETDESDSDNS